MNISGILILRLFIAFVSIVGPELVVAGVQPIAPYRCEDLFVEAGSAPSIAVTTQLRDVPLRARIQIALQVLGEYSVGAELFVPKVFSTFKGSPNAQDYSAITTSWNNMEKEVMYVEVADSRGKILFRSDFEIGTKSTVESHRLLKALLKALKEQNLKNEFVVIRDVHTHPTALSNGGFSAADIRGSTLFHALAEMAGLTNFRYEASILYFKLSKMKYEKKTMVIPESTLSYANGDFSLGKKLDVIFRSLSHEDLRNIGESL